MKKLLTLCLLAVTMCAMAQEQVQSKRIAILETVDKDGTVPYGIKLQLRQSITFAISRTPGYDAYNRVDMSSINGEQTFQRTGMVSDADIKKLGVMTGAAYVLIAEAAPYDDAHIIITANLVNVESAQVESATYPIVSDKNPEAMAESCKKIAQILLNVSGAPSPTSPQPPYTAGNSSFTVNGVSFKMVPVKGGTFTMGGTYEQSGDTYDDEKPTHSVTLSDYCIGETEVTQALWTAVMGSNPSGFKGDNLPVENVSWYDVEEFLTKLNQKTGRFFRLPTEAEWEYAARGGNKSQNYKYSGSNNVDFVAWYGNTNGHTHEVRTKQPNELGIYDMSGNVWEWCADWYGNYGSYSQTNPTGPSSGSDRVLRGGSWNLNARHCRVSSRNINSPDYWSSNRGFRLVLVP